MFKFLVLWLFVLFAAVLWCNSESYNVESYRDDRLWLPKTGLYGDRGDDFPGLYGDDWNMFTSVNFYPRAY